MLERGSLILYLAASDRAVLQSLGILCEFGVTVVFLSQMFLMIVHVAFCRRAERFQHPPGVAVSRGGGLPENDPRGAARPGSKEHPGPGPTPAVRRLHVHVPEPDHEPVQVESSP